jgi:hypothetical protein
MAAPAEALFQRQPGPGPDLGLAALHPFEKTRQIIVPGGRRAAAMEHMDGARAIWRAIKTAVRDCTTWLSNINVIPGRAESANPESRDSGFDAIGPANGRTRRPRPGMTERSNLLKLT